MADFKMKVAILGDTAVGKTSITLRFVEDSFFEEKVPNVQELMTKEIAVENKRCGVEVCDTGGHEQFRTVTASHFRGAEALMVVFDVTKQDTFDRVNSWLEEADMYIKKGYFNRTAGIDIEDNFTPDHRNRRLLIGNKVDLEAQRQVTPEQARAFANDNGMQYFECSAKTGKGIAEPFLLLAREGLEERLQSGALNAKGDGEVTITTKKSSTKGCTIL